jgi:hypothetical protein
VSSDDSNVFQPTGSPADWGESPELDVPAESNKGSRVQQCPTLAPPPKFPPHRGGRPPGLFINGKQQQSEQK